MLELWINFIPNLFILMKFSTKFETLAISLSFISQRAVKAWIIEDCFISTMFVIMIQISKIFYTKMLSRFYFQNLILLSRKSVSGEESEPDFPYWSGPRPPLVEWSHSKIEIINYYVIYLFSEDSFRCHVSLHPTPS